MGGAAAEVTAKLPAGWSVLRAPGNVGSGRTESGLDRDRSKDVCNAYLREEYRRGVWRKRRAGGIAESWDRDGVGAVPDARDGRRHQLVSVKGRQRGAGVFVGSEFVRRKTLRRFCRFVWRGFAGAAAKTAAHVFGSVRSGSNGAEAGVDGDATRIAGAGAGGFVAAGE